MLYITREDGTPDLEAMDAASRRYTTNAVASLELGHMVYRGEVNGVAALQAIMLQTESLAELPLTAFNAIAFVEGIAVGAYLDANTKLTRVPHKHPTIQESVDYFLSLTHPGNHP